MLKHTLLGSVLIGSLSLGSLTGCENLPGSKGTQGAVGGGAGGAAAGALIGGSHHRLLGALLGGAAGAGGGYLIGAHMDKTKDPNRNHDSAVQASRDAESRPAKSSDVIVDSRTQTADLNNDGYVTMDEVVAMRKAGLSDDEMVRRLNDTRHVFDLTDSQQNYLRDNGVDRRVIDAMLSMGQDNSRTAGYPDSSRDSDRRSIDSRDTRDSRDLDRRDPISR